MAATLTDSHCHLNFELLRNNLPQVLQNARENGVGHMLCVGVTIEKLPEVLALAHDHANIFASVGVHPHEQQGHDPSVEELVQLAGDSRVVAIGETGLDYYRIKGDMTWQQDRFRRHIHAARLTRKPLIIHTREAAADTIRVLQEEGAESVGGVMHCFTESWETARAALDLGFYISFSGIITFRNAESLRAVASKVPSDRLLVETDAPYLAPVPFRGRTNEPAYVRHVAMELAKLRGISLEELASCTTQNFFALFRHAQPVSSEIH
jgi:TatD DNase family protein